MKQWNEFQSWLKEKGYAGDKKMNHKAFSQAALDEYRRSHPDFWIKGSDEITKVQPAVKLYRTVTLMQ